MRPTSHSFEDLLNAVHKEGITLSDYNGIKIPCIFVKKERFDEIVQACYGKPLLIDTNLNILHDDMKHVFVEIQLRFTKAGVEQKVLLYANESLEFFEHLALSGLLALAPEATGSSSTNIFMVQLPRKDAIEDALELIKSYLK
ncbi:MAG: hypothetical protein ACE5J2_04215 [Nitrososphaerales archaeon]